MRFLAIFPLLAVGLAACQWGTPQSHPVPSVRQIGSDLKCSTGDHGYEDPAGWGFCYPGTWKYNLRSQPSVDRSGNQVLDLIFDVTDVPTVNGTPLPACPSPPPLQQGGTPVCDPDAGKFGVILVSTYQRAGAGDLATWLAAELPPQATTPIFWGNAQEAVLLADGRRVALTPTQVVVLALRGGGGNLDLETAMSARLGTWKFLY